MPPPMVGQRFAGELVDLEGAEDPLAVAAPDAPHGVRVDLLETANDRLRIVAPRSGEPGPDPGVSGR